MKRAIAILLLCIVCYTVLAVSSCTGHLNFTSRTEHWSEDVLLNDGKLIKVEREVDWTTQIVLTDPFFGFPTIPHLSGGWPDKFRLKFKNPDTQERIQWQGERHYCPVLLDVLNGVPYLVVYGKGSKKTESIYGCPELPYIYLKHESGFFSKWLPVSVEKVPDELRFANLTVNYPEFSDFVNAVINAQIVAKRGGRAQRDMSATDIQKTMDHAENLSDGFFQRRIPRNYQEWKYPLKNHHRNERQYGDCRPPLQPLTDILIPEPVDVELETIESTDYIAKNFKEYYKYLSEKKGTITHANCLTLFRPPNPENLMLGERFVKDPTSNIRLPYSGPSPLPLRMLEKRTERYCDNNFVWFVARHEELEKTIITKYSASGDFLYNIRIANPKNVDGKFSGKMVPDSLTTENNFLYFYWNQDIKRPGDRSLVYPNRMLKFRFSELIGKP